MREYIRVFFSDNSINIYLHIYKYRLDEMFPHRGLLLTVVAFFFDFVICSESTTEEFQIPAQLAAPATWETVINTGCRYNSVSRQA